MTMMAFEVSVIIPVYNAEKYVERAILSAVNQSEVKEVIVVDDGHKDGALAVCQQLAQAHPKIKLFTHPNGENRGAGASRNLAILNSACEYLAFLDADDYFLPNRFEHTQKVFINNEEVDAVYEPVGVEFSSEAAKQRFMSIKSRVTAENATAFLSYPINPVHGEEMFLSLAKGGNDGPCTDGLTIRKSLLARGGLFNTHLKLHQDTEFWTRLSYYGYFSSTGVHHKAVAIRTMHDENRTYAQNIKSKTLLARALLSWATQENLNPEIFNIFLAKYQSLMNQK